MRIRLLLLGLLLVPSWVGAAVNCADANAVADTFGTPSDPMTQSYTNPGGSDVVGFVLAGVRNGGSAHTVNSMTWNATATTSITTARYTDPSGGQLFRLIAPPSGTQTVSTDWTGAGLANGVVIFVCTSVHQTTPEHDAISTTGSGTTASTTVSNVTASDVVIACVTKDGNEAMTGGGSLVAIKNDNASASEMNVGCWYQPGSAGGSVSITWTGTQQWTIHAAAISPPASIDSSGGLLWFP